MQSPNYKWPKSIRSKLAYSQRDSFNSSPSTRIPSKSSATLSPIQSSFSIQSFNSSRVFPRFTKEKLPKFKQRTSRPLCSRLKLSVDHFIEVIEKTNIELEEDHKRILAKLPSIKKDPTITFNTDPKSFMHKLEKHPTRKQMNRVFDRIQQDLHRTATEVFLMG